MRRIQALASILGIASICTAAEVPKRPPREQSVVSVDAKAPKNAGVPMESFVAYSIEFSSFVDFAGNISHPNTFSNTLLNNLGDLQGTKPYIRVGGNTQDFAVFNESLDVAIVGIVQPEISADYPTIIHIGPKWFQSYRTWPDVKYVHGFNLGRNSTVAREGLIDSAPYACNALKGGRLLNWELGNEPDLFSSNGARPPSWNPEWYVRQWLHWTRRIYDAMTGPCPKLAEYKYVILTVGHCHVLTLCSDITHPH
jgi:hypothetical protein